MMKPQPAPVGAPDTDRFTLRLKELRQAVALQDPWQLATKTGSLYTPSTSTTGHFQLKMWGQPWMLTFPELIALDVSCQKEGTDLHQAMLMYYFSSADGSPATGQWISFAEFPNGRFYNQAFQSYTGNLLAAHFQKDRLRFIDAARKSGGVSHPIGDAAFVFGALPYVELMVVNWQGDDEFPSSYKLLFDASASHYLPTDAFAILGSTLTRRLIKSSQAS